MSIDDLISVTIPAYNHEKYIEECVRSIMTQTYRNIELLVIDDGSKDKTFEILQSLRPECEKRFVRFVLETQENRGVYYTGNKLFRMAQGKYIYTIASDDVSKPDAIKRLHAFLEENPDYVLAVGDNEIINGDSKRVYWGKERQLVPENEALYKTFGENMHLNEPNNEHPNFGSYEDLLKGNYIPNGYLYSRLAMAEAEAPIEGILLEDWFMHIRLCKKGKYKYIPEILFSYRWHGNNTVSSPEYKAKALEIHRQIYLHEKEYCFAHGYKKQWKHLWCKRCGWRSKWKKLRNFIRGKNDCACRIAPS